MQKQPLSDKAVSNFLACLLETVNHVDANSVDIIGLEKNVAHEVLTKKLQLIEHKLNYFGLSVVFICDITVIDSIPSIYTEFISKHGIFVGRCILYLKYIYCVFCNKVFLAA